VAACPLSRNAQRLRVSVSASDVQCRSGTPPQGGCKLPHTLKQCELEHLALQSSDICQFRTQIRFPGQGKGGGGPADCPRVFAIPATFFLHPSFRIFSSILYPHRLSILVSCPCLLYSLTHSMATTPHLPQFDIMSNFVYTLPSQPIVRGVKMRVRVRLIWGSTRGKTRKQVVSDHM
jgi:hypothetical protein